MRSGEARGPGARGLWWFLVPVVSFGYLTFLVVFHAGRVLRSRAALIAAAFYLAVDIAFVVDASHGWAGVLTAAAFGLVNWVGGTVHAAHLTTQYRDRVRATAAPPPWTPADLRPEAALVAARMAIARRIEARHIVETDPPLAFELRIGRPDLYRSYDDGGLVDVNHVPVEHLIAELDMQPATADEVITMRDLRDGFASADDMLIACDSLNPERLDMLRDRLIFLPRDIAPKPIAQRLRRGTGR